MVYLGILTKNEYKFTVYHRCYEHMSRYVLIINHTPHHKSTAGTEVPACCTAAAYCTAVVITVHTQVTRHGPRAAVSLSTCASHIPVAIVRRFLVHFGHCTQVDLALLFRILHSCSPVTGVISATARGFGVRGIENGQ